MYSEKEFARKLLEKCFIPYYPFKDVGIDILATKGNEIYKFQLKARNQTYLSQNNTEYWFLVKENRLKEEIKVKNMFYVFCALLPNNEFDFFVLPVKRVYHWFKEYQKEGNTKQNEIFLCIRPIGKHKYEIRPKRIKFNVNKYLW